MNDLFLNYFKRDRQLTNIVSTSESNVYFQLKFNNEGRCYVEIVNAAGQAIDVNYRSFSGDMYTLLRSFENISESISEDIVWSGESRYVFIDEHPQLIYQLIKCGRMIDSRCHEIKAAQGKYHIELCVLKLKDELIANSTIVPDSDEAGLKDSFKFELINDFYALHDHKLYQINPIGANYSKLKVFNTTLDKSQAALMLSIVLSNFDNINITFEGKRTIVHESPLQTVPTLVIDKVDSDGSLYMHTGHFADGINPDFIKDFSPSVTVNINDDNVHVHKLEYNDLGDTISMLRKKLVSFAPSRTLAKEIYEEDGFFIVPPHTAENFLLSGLAGLVKQIKIIGIEKLGGYKIRPARPFLKLQVSSGIDFLEGTGDVDVEGEEFSLKDFLNQYKKNKYIQLSNGDKAVIDEEYIHRIERLISKGKGANGIKVSFFDLPEIARLLKEEPQDAIFRKSRDFYEGFNRLKEEQCKTKGFTAELRPYQQEGLKWIKYLHDNGMGGCLADDMGLGKTVQTIGMLSSLYPQTKEPSLIVMPKSLLFNWASEFERFAPRLKVGSYYGTDRDIDKALSCQIILTTYAIARNDIEILGNRTFHYVILDESQNIKNLNAQITRAILLLKCKHKLALSGTPVENNLMELYSLFRFLNPAMLGTEEEFNSRYAGPVHKDNDKEALAELRRKIFPFMLRRLKKDVLDELPDRTDQTLYVDMDDAHARLYEQRRKKYYNMVKESISKEGVAKSQFLMLQALSELRRIASVPESLSDGLVLSSKIPVLADSIAEAVINGHKVVAFFNFIAGIEITGEKLEEQGIEYAVMTGSTRDREAVVKRFQNTDKCKVLLMTLKTGGVGLNLTAADTVFIFEPWWNKAAEEQAINRLYRIGQKNNVNSYSLIVRGTIEEKIKLLQEQKTELFESLISADTSNSKTLSEEDIDFILG